MRMFGFKKIIYVFFGNLTTQNNSDGGIRSFFPQFTALFGLVVVSAKSGLIL